MSKNTIRVSIEHVDSAGKVIRSHCATRTEDGTFDSPYTKAFGEALAEALLTMTFDSPRKRSLPVLNDPADVESDDRLDILLIAITNLPLGDSAAWMLVKILGDAWKDYGKHFAQKLKFKLERD